MGGTSTAILCLALSLTLVHGDSSNGCIRSGVCNRYTTGATIIRNPEDCGSFCVCTCDGAILMNCPSGLEFSDTTNQCDWKYKANCSIPLPPRPNGCDIWEGYCSSAIPGTLNPNPADCGSYCVCDGSRSIYMRCPVGLHFSVSTNRCEYPNTAGCIPGSTPNPEPNYTTYPPPSGSCENVTSQCNGAPIGTLLRNPDDCGSYCVCDGSTAVWMPCPAGLHFSVITNRCEYPNTAGCIPGSTPTPGPIPTQTYPTPKPSPNGCELVQYLCPAVNVGNATLLPNPTDCGSYCVCDWGRSIWMPCPAGLHFNPVLHVCDWPYEAGCLSTGSTPNPEPNYTTYPPPSGSCKNVTSQCDGAPIGTLLRNPDDCGSYCVCDGSTAVWMPCPAGLHFSVITNRCEYPNTAGCIPGSTPTPGPIPTQTYPTPKPSPNGCELVQYLCPAVNVGNATLLPNPTDCGSYCVCDWGRSIWMPCPAGLHFNPVLHVCDWPYEAGCLSTGSTPNPEPNYTTYPPPSGSCENVTSQCDGAPIGTLLRNPDDCGSYCVCDGSTAVWMPCPAGLHFSVITNRCEYPNTAGCIPGSTPTPGPIPTQTYPTPKPSPNGCELVQYLCPAVNVGNATLLPNPTDCGSYCVCDWGRSIWMPCPAGLHFNPVLHVCDWPYEAGCLSTFFKRS